MEALEPAGTIAAGEGRFPQWVTAILLLPLIYFIPAFYLKILPMWRTGLPMYDPIRPPVWWPLGIVLWRALIRITIPLGALMGPALIPAAIFYFIPEDHPLVWPTVAIVSACVVASIYLQVAVGIFNRSLFLVPPPYRRWPGASDEWSGRRRFEDVEPELEEWERPWKLPWPPPPA